MNKSAKPAGHYSAVRQVMLGTVSTLSLLAAAATTASAKTITVKQGDTVWSLAQREGLTVNSLEQANPSVSRLNNSIDLIYAGQTLNLPAGENDGYVVKKGDTLSAIADQYHVTVQQLTTWNHLSDENYIYVGQRLTVDGRPLRHKAIQSHPVSQTPAANRVQSATNGALQAARQDQPAAPQPESQREQQPVAANQASQSSAMPARQPQQVAQTNTATATADQGSTSSSASVNSQPATKQTDTSQPASPVDSQQTAPKTQATQAAPASSSAYQGTGQSQAARSAAAQNPAKTAEQAPSQPAEPTTQTAQQASQSQSAVQNNSQAGSTTAKPDLQSGSVVSLAVKLANSNIPYVYGGSSLSGMDCSGLVDYVYAHSEGKQLPHYTVSLENCVSQKPVSQAQPGDLLFWGGHGSSYHVAIYIGNNQYVAAPQPGQNVDVENISPYFMPSFAGSVN